MASAARFSRNHVCRPGRAFQDGVELAGWEQQSVWGYDTGLGSYYAQLWANGSSSDAPEILLSGVDTVYPCPSRIALEIVERLDEDTLAVVRGLGLADPDPTLRSADEVNRRVAELGALGTPSRYVAGQMLALGWTQGLVKSCPGSHRHWIRPRKPSPARVDAEHQLVASRAHRGDDPDLDSGAATALGWALGRDDSPRTPDRERISPALSGTSAVAPTGERDPGRIWLDVPFAEKDDVKALGARYDSTVERWYAPDPDAAPALARWTALPDIPELLPGEDRSLGSGLFVDLAPSACWFTNVRSCVSPRDWERLRRMIINRAGRRCEVCGQTLDRAAGRQLEAHERWTYDEHSGVQALRRLICLCDLCHTVTHFGLAELRGRAVEALAHLKTVTGMTDRQARTHVDQAFALWQERSTRTWTLDLSMLTNAGVTLAEPPDPADRVHIAKRTLRRRR